MKVLSSGFIVPQLHCSQKEIRDSYNLETRKQGSKQTRVLLSGSKKT